jgi:pilus assembly protein CpaB
MDSSRRLVILLVAGVIVAFAAIALRNHLSEEPPAPAEVVTRVIIAKHDIAAGTLIQSGSDLDWAPAPEGAEKEPLLHEGTATVEGFNGAVVRRQLKAGEPVPQSAIMKSGEGGFMSAVLEPGMRAVSIAVTATSGNAGFISPGDRIDLIVTHHVKLSTGAGETAISKDMVVSETFVRNVRVLAVDQMLDNPENKAILAKTVTVEVNDHQAEQISVAGEMGKISVSLRSLTNAEKKDQQPGITDLYGTRESDVSQMLGGTYSPRIKVMRGDQIENLEFTQ